MGKLWNVRGVGQAARAKAKGAAEACGVTLGMWIERAIEQTAEEDRGNQESAKISGKTGEPGLATGVEMEKESSADRSSGLSGVNSERRLVYHSGPSPLLRNLVEKAEISGPGYATRGAESVVYHSEPIAKDELALATSQPPGSVRPRAKVQPAAADSGGSDQTQAFPTFRAPQAKPGNVGQGKARPKPAAAEEPKATKLRCIHGTKRGFNCWQCGGLAAVLK